MGLFPRSRQSSLGLEDLAGNVEEWCEPGDRQDGDDAAGPRVLRGGAFVVRAWNLRATYRAWVEVEVRYRNGGFRCVLAPRRQP